MTSQDNGVIVCLADYEKIAAKKLCPATYDYIRSGADDQVSIAENIEAFKRSVYLLHMKVFFDSLQRSMQGW